jgi:hypothetical protein
MREPAAVTYLERLRRLARLALDED